MVVIWLEVPRMDRVGMHFSLIKWAYAEGDPRARRELQERIASTGVWKG